VRRRAINHFGILVCSRVGQSTRLVYLLAAETNEFLRPPFRFLAQMPVSIDGLSILLSALEQ
jgi:hypothetical protein